MLANAVLAGCVAKKRMPKSTYRGADRAKLEDLAKAAYMQRYATDKVLSIVFCVC